MAPTTTTTKQQRSAASYVALVRDTPDVHILLPQVILVTKRFLTNAQMRYIGDALPPNAFIWRRDSGWSTAETTATILTIMRERIRRFSSTLAPILLLDTAPSHTNSIAYNACNRNDIRFLFVPAKMTWLLQPLDVAGFAIFKLRLRQFYIREQIRARHGQVATVNWMRLLGTAIRTVTQGTKWSRTFDGCGITPLQTGLRHRMLKDIGCEEGVSLFHQESQASLRLEQYSRSEDVYVRINC